MREEKKGSKESDMGELVIPSPDFENKIVVLSYICVNVCLHEFNPTSGSICVYRDWSSLGTHHHIV